MRSVDGLWKHAECLQLGRIMSRFSSMSLGWFWWNRTRGSVDPDDSYYVVTGFRLRQRQHNSVAGNALIKTPNLFNVWGAELRANNAVNRNGAFPYYDGKFPRYIRTYVYIHAGAFVDFPDDASTRGNGEPRVFVLPCSDVFIFRRVNIENYSQRAFESFALALSVYVIGSLTIL